ncbi:MAG: hypothetical protein M3443_12020 [Actinomycetota bacterium]|nr:hypothetical protein [Actinomycetota bacterium]
MDLAVVASAERVSSKAIEWLHANRERFALPRGVPAELIDIGVFKSLGELTLAGWIAHREAAAGARTNQIAGELLDYVWDEFGEGDVLYRMQVRNPSATHAIETYSMLHAAGYRSPALCELAGHLSTLRSYEVLDLTPNRQLAVSAALRRIGLTPWAELTDLVGRTWLGGMPEPWMLDTYNGYSLTHTVFHLTEHGERPDALPVPLRDYLSDWLPVWMDVYAESGFWDLMGELIIVGTNIAGMDVEPGPWERFAQAQDDDGMTPNGINRPTKNAVNRVETHYHPTVVAAIAGALVAARGLDAARPADQVRA